MNIVGPLLAQRIYNTKLNFSLESTSILSLSLSSSFAALSLSPELWALGAQRYIYNIYIYASCVEFR